ncbi:hypothetical protein NA63_1590 [Flavobacteriaceae bacterium MAR_2010_105]|nr:hypothetical protein NA63_1590 [Flavobacteriaceae bacterium MAR_2010_105]
MILNWIILKSSVSHKNCSNTLKVVTKPDSNRQTINIKSIHNQKHKIHETN